MNRETPISEFAAHPALTIRAKNLLRGYFADKTVGDLIDTPDSALLRVPNCGRYTLNVIKNALIASGAAKSQTSVTLTIELTGDDFALLHLLAGDIPIGVFVSELVRKAAKRAANMPTLDQRIERLEREVFGQG